MADNETPELKYHSAMQEFLHGRGWENDELKIDVVDRTVEYYATLDIGQTQGRVVVAAHEDDDLVDVYIYFGFKCKEAKRIQMAETLNGIHRRCAFGCFDMDPEDGELRWHHRVHFEGCTPTGTAVENIFGPGWSVCRRYVDVLTAVALTKQSPAEAFADFDTAEEFEEMKSTDRGRQMLN